MFVNAKHKKKQEYRKCPWNKNYCYYSSKQFGCDAYFCRSPLQFGTPIVSTTDLFIANKKLNKVNKQYQWNTIRIKEFSHITIRESDRLNHRVQRTMKLSFETKINQ